MSFFGFLSTADSQDSALSRRELLGKSASIALAATAMKLPPKQPAPPKYPSPEFNIGDLVAQDWEPDDDEAPEFATDFGEILGMRWIPKPDSYCSVANTWVYFVRWTHSSCPGCLPEPYCDGELILASDLRLVKESQEAQ
jgi:hypothetical protein